MTRTRARTAVTMLPLAILLAVLLAPSPAAAQEPCDDGRPPRAWIGVHAIHCPGGSCAYLYRLSGADGRTVARIRAEPGRAADEMEPMYDFAAEPWLRGIDGSGPAAGALEEGDILVAVNGYLITTERGGLELANLTAGEAAELTVRRGERLRVVSLVPELRCETQLMISGSRVAIFPAPDAPLPPRAGLPPAAAGAPAAPTPAGPSAVTPPRSGRPAGVAPPAPLPPVPGASAPDAMPPPAAPLPASGVGAGRRGLGAALGCSDCSFRIDDDGNFTWAEARRVEVVAVSAGGAADRAGLRPGDVITHVNGEPVETDRAGQALFRADSGDVLDLRVLRGDDVLEIGVEVGTDVAVEPVTVVRSERGDWSGLGRLARGLGGLGRGSGRLAHGDVSLTISGELWGPTSLGLLFESCGDCQVFVTDAGIETRLDDHPVVVEVVEDGPADRAGLRPGDTILTVNGRDVTEAGGTRLLLNAPPGERLTVGYRRGGEEHTTSLTPR